MDKQGPVRSISFHRRGEKLGGGILFFPDSFWRYRSRGSKKRPSVEVRGGSEEGGTYPLQLHEEALRQ